MLVQLKKKEEIDGAIWYNIWVDSECIKSYYEEAGALIAYQKILERVKLGYPKEIILLSTTI